jgi:hypothetical protein
MVREGHHIRIILIFFLHSARLHCAEHDPSFARLPGPLTMISRDGIHGGMLTATKPGSSAGLFLSPTGGANKKPRLLP